MGSRPETINMLVIDAVKKGERPQVPHFKDVAFCGTLKIMKEFWVQYPDERL